MSAASVFLWGTEIGAVAIPDDTTLGSFRYTDRFVGSGIEVAPLTMPLAARTYRFPDLEPRTFHGLPGLLADALPDRFGNQVIDAWLATQGRPPGSMDPVERLCYIGTRGMGALEFRPATGPRPATADPVRIDALTQLAADVLASRERLHVRFDDAPQGALRDILLVGTSAGGARAKALIAWSPTTGEVRTGHAGAPEGFEHWLLKFDGVAGNGDHDITDPLGYGAVEHAYALMARDAGIVMTATRLLEDGPRRHFMTRRFDRTPDGERLHMQTLGAMRHFDYNDPTAYSYEQAVHTCRMLDLPIDDIDQMARRAVFNVVARNQDDHVKNISFLMDRSGTWTLAPAYDITYNHNPDGMWTRRHQMSLNDKRTDFVRRDVDAFLVSCGLSPARRREIVADVTAAVYDRWAPHAASAGVPDDVRDRIAGDHRRIV
ncbi:MAG: type II toxin-antitoxin system HipA family toxin [Solirubrobacteraceae bacterium]|nr:type II toxin-antitoxin system HipA family toxin [Solirubrobacteraceae bacterium]